MRRPTWVMLAAAVFGSAPVLVDATPAQATVARCSALEKQYDTTPKERVSADKLAKAQVQRERGADLCASGKLDGGVKALKKALEDVGAKPT